MNVHDLYQLIDEQAPLSLSKEFCATFDMYDNSGLLLNFAQEVTGVVFSLDFSMMAINTAIAKGYTAIVTHHPAIFGGVKQINIEGDILSRKLALCAQHGISVISMHLNLDIAPNGIDDNLMYGLGGKEPQAVLDGLKGGAYGKVYAISPCTFGVYTQQIKTTFQTEKARFYGDARSQVKKVASFCGAGSSDEALAFALKHQVDVFVSADMKHHHITALRENGVCVVVLTHYASENYGFTQFYNNINSKLSLPHTLVVEEELL